MCKKIDNGEAIKCISITHLLTVAFKRNFISIKHYKNIKINILNKILFYIIAFLE